VPAALDVAQTGDTLKAEALYSGMAEGLKSLGFNLNFGPVVDLDLNPDNPIIGHWKRSYGADPDTVVAFARAFVGAHRRAGILTALKHFPGHGSSEGDSHEGFVDISRTWQPQELDPFRDLAASGDADMVMVAHLFHEKFGTHPDERQPASLSPAWIEGVLRHQIGYEGVVITDDLEMGAIRQRFSLAQSVVAAVRAGADILLFSNTVKPHIGLAEEIQKILVDTAEADPAFRSRIAQSYGRIVALKKSMR
jgi:beta-N-acetylhexosaminidase